MDIRVDLPAPFSPTMPWIVPGWTEREMSLFACTGPKALEIPFSSMAGGGVVMSCPLRVVFLCGTGRDRYRARPVPENRNTPVRCILPGRSELLHLHGAGAVFGEVVNHDLTRDDAGAGGFDGCDHLFRDEFRVVLVKREAYAFLGQSEDEEAGFHGIAAGEGVIDGNVHTLHHRGQNRTGMQVVLVAVHADRQDAFVGCHLKNAKSRATCGRVDHVCALCDLATGQFA